MAVVEGLVADTGDGVVYASIGNCGIDSNSAGVFCASCVSAVIGYFTFGVGKLVVVDSDAIGILGFEVMSKGLGGEEEEKARGE